MKYLNIGLISSAVLISLSLIGGYFYVRYQPSHKQIDYINMEDFVDNHSTDTDSSNELISTDTDSSNESSDNEYDFEDASDIP